MSSVRSTHGGRITVLLGTDLGGQPGRSDLSWGRDPRATIQAIDEMRVSTAPILPSPAHEALARLQQAMTPHRCKLVTRCIDGLLLKAAAAEVLELDGSLWRLRCSADPGHPRIGIFGRQSPERCCATCGAPMRPDVRLGDEPPEHLPEAHAAIAESRVFLCAETTAGNPVVHGMLDVATAASVKRWQVHPQPTADLFDETLAVSADEGVPRLVRQWLAEGA